MGTDEYRLFQICVSICNATAVAAINNAILICLALTHGQHLRCSSAISLRVGYTGSTDEDSIFIPNDPSVFSYNKIINTSVALSVANSTRFANATLVQHTAQVSHILILSVVGNDALKQSGAWP